MMFREGSASAEVRWPAFVTPGDRVLVDLVSVEAAQAGGVGLRFRLTCLTFR